MKASRRSRGASEMRKEREKREAEKNKKKERKKRNAGSSPAPSAALQAAPARETTFRVWPAGWRSGSRTEEVELEMGEGRKLELKIGNGKMEEWWK